MVRKRSYPTVTIHALLMVISMYSLVFLLSIPVDHYGPTWRLIPLVYQYNLVGEETPVFRYNATPGSVWMEIASLQTNNTPVALSVSDESGILLNVTNVTSVSGFSMIVARIQYHDLWLELARLESDANVTITLSFWSTVWINGLVFYPLEVVLIPVLLLAYSLYRLARMALIGISDKSQWKTGRGPASIILLLILGAACITPLTQGNLRSDFIPMPAPQVSRENHSLTLNESSSLMVT